MLDFGFAAAVHSGLQIFENMSRRTGRSTDLVRHARKGDAIVVKCSKDKAHVQHLLYEQKKHQDVAVWIMNPERQLIGQRGTIPTGVVHFDHRFIEAFWISRMAKAESELKCAHEAMSKLYLRDADRDRLVGHFGVDLD